MKVLWGSVSADFRQFQVGGEGKREERYGIDKKSESKLSHTAPTSTVDLCLE